VPVGPIGGVAGAGGGTDPPPPPLMAAAGTRTAARSPVAMRAPHSMRSMPRTLPARSGRRGDHGVAWFGPVRRSGVAWLVGEVRIVAVGMDWVVGEDRKGRSRWRGVVWIGSSERMERGRIVGMGRSGMSAGLGRGRVVGTARGSVGWGGDWIVGAEGTGEHRIVRRQGLDRRRGRGRLVGMLGAGGCDLTRRIGKGRGGSSGRLGAGWVVGMGWGGLSVWTGLSVRVGRVGRQGPGWADTEGSVGVVGYG